MTRWWRNYALLAICWGLPFYFIMLSLESFSPVHIAFLRFVIGAAILWLVTAFTRTLLPRNPVVYGHLFVMALFLNSVPGVLFATSEQYVSSIFAGIMNGATPLMALLATLVLFREQTATRSQKVGLVIGFGGLVTVLGAWQGLQGGSAMGFAMLLVAVAGYGISFPYSRRYIYPHGVAPVAIATIQVSFGALQLLPFAIFSSLPDAVSTESLVGVMGLGIVSTALAYLLHFDLLQSGRTLIASTVTYWTPLVAVLAGTTLLGEHLSWHEPVGAIVIVIGLLVAQERINAGRLNPLRR